MLLLMCYYIKFHWKILFFLGFLMNFVFYLLQGKPPDWQDFVGIITLLIINSTISFIEENNAGNAAAALMAGLAPKTKVITLTMCIVDCRQQFR